MKAISIAVLSACLALASGAFAQDGMKKDSMADHSGMMKNDSMAMTKKDCEEHMAMAKKDGMKKDDAMMKKDAACADMMKKDSMAKKDGMADHSGMMKK